MHIRKSKTAAKEKRKDGFLFDERKIKPRGKKELPILRQSFLLTGVPCANTFSGRETFCREKGQRSQPVAAGLEA